MEQPTPDRGRRYTEEEYLRISAASDVKYEFRRGRLIPFGGWERDDGGRILGMAGGTAEHADVAANVLRALGNRLEKTGSPPKLLTTGCGPLQVGGMEPATGACDGGPGDGRGRVADADRAA